MSLLAPEKHEGWGLFRAAWAFSMLFTWAQRGIHFPERYTAAGPIVKRSYAPLADTLILTEPTGWVVYGVLIAALLAVFFNRLTRPATMLAMGIVAFLCLFEGLNFKGYDRLMFLQGICLLAAPKGIDGKATAVPLGRMMLVLLYCSIYGQTGIHKILDEPRWWEGTPLAYDMVHRAFGLKPLGVAISDVPWLMKFMSWSTLVFEAGFPLAVWFRWTRIPWLVVGVLFHLGILVMMNVPNFCIASVIGYPLLLRPDEYAAGRDWVLARLPGRAKTASTS